ncbi:NADH-ubiquinone oxidoreductase chain 6, partial [Apaloderma vittatum]
LAVTSNPLPYYEVICLAVTSTSGCRWLLSLRVSFVLLILFMVYLRGMLVDFSYSLSLATDSFPEVWGVCC